MKITQRPVALALLSLLAISTLLILISQLVADGLTLQLIPTGIGLLLEIGLLYFYSRGWEPARYGIVILVTLLIAFGTEEPFLKTQATLALFIPAAMALILATPAWVVGSTIVVYITLLLRAGGQGIYATPATFLICVIVIGGIVLGRLITDTAQRAVEENARRAETEKARAEQQARELAEANQLMNTQLDQQQELLDLVTTLETPAVPLAEGVLFAPIVGHVDTRRAQALTSRLLEEASNQRARLVVLDIAGVSVMDTSVAKSLLNTAQALRLLGCEVTISGISATVAMTLIQLGVNLKEVRTARSPQEALAQYLSSVPLSGKIAPNSKSSYN